MKRSIAILLVFMLINHSYAQKHDYIWLSGYGSDTYLDTTGRGYTYGISKIDFNSDPISISYDSLGMNFSRTNVTISDSNGDLLFYTNGIYVANRFDEKIENGDSLNAGYLQYGWDTDIENNGYRFTQAILSIPDVKIPNTFNLVHSYIDTIDGTSTADLYCPRILATQIDMSANNGHGKVNYKNKPLIIDDFGSELAATRHGNGRDWWMLVHKKNTNCYYRIVVDSSGPHTLSALTCSDSIIPQNDIGSATFSPDGSKYAYFSITTGLKIFDFDRCLGELSNPIHIAMNIRRDSNWTASGVAISPNNRFLYLSIEKRLLQYDLWAADIPASVETVGVYDGYYIIVPGLGSFFMVAQSGPDGKIYISCPSSLPVYSVINNPDQKGVACNFLQHSLHLPTLSSGVPNYPNYRLGRLVGSECDTLWNNIDEETINQREKILKIFPNPATDIVIIDYGFIDWSIGGVVSLEIVNNLGQLVHTQPVPQYSGFQKIDVSRYAAGLYTTYIKRNNALVSTGKFAKQ